MGKKTGNPSVVSDERKVRAACDRFLEKLGDACTEAVEKTFGILGGGRGVLASILLGSLHTLKSCIEDETDKDVSWENPWVESHYPVEFDWESKLVASPHAVLPESVVNTLNRGEDPIKENLEEVKDYTAELLCGEAEVQVLLALTNHIAVYQEKGETAGFILLGHEEDQTIQAMPEEERDVRIKKMLKPFVIGGAAEFTRYEDGEDPLLAVPVSEEGRAIMDAEEGASPYIGFEGEVNGTRFQGTVILMVYPLVANSDTKEAYFPIVCGVTIAPQGAVPIENMEEVMAALDPSTWPEKDRADLWDTLLVELPRVLEEGSGGTEKEAEDALHHPPRALVPQGTPAPEFRYLHDAPTRVDRSAAAFLAHTGGLNLPRRWKDVRRWEEIAQEEVDRILDSFGEEAFQDLRRKTQDPNAHGPLLERRTDSKGETVVRLSREAEEMLQTTAGPKGYRKRVTDPDGVPREYLIKRFKAKSGYLETRLSWYGMAAPFVEEGMDDLRMQVENLQERGKQKSLFEELDSAVQDELNRRLRFLEAIRDARLIMARILYDFGNVGENPLRVPAWQLRSLLECENDKDGSRRVRGCLRALQEVRFTLKAAGVPGLSREISGAFLNEVDYLSGGPGAHTDGYFLLSISDNFVGCLNVFKRSYGEIRDPHKVFYDFNKKLSKEEKQGLDYLQGFSALAPYYDKAKGFTLEQSNLRTWIEHNITRRKDAAKPGRGEARLKPHMKDADEPRLYGSSFCPLLPKDSLYHGALGHYSHNAETGRKLFGVPAQGSDKSGAHHGGLLYEMKYFLPSGAAKTKREEVVRAALRDLKAVVVEAFGGVVAGKHGGQWVSLSDAEKIPVDTLLKEVSWYLFLAQDWRDRIPKEVEDYHAKRHARGETPYLIKTTKDRRIVERTEDERFLPIKEGLSGLEAEPLRTRLYIARKERKISQANVGKFFGVSQKTVDYWEKGAKPDEDGKVRGKAIPQDVSPLLVRWIETNVPPSEEELGALAARRNIRPGTKKQE